MFSSDVRWIQYFFHWRPSVTQECLHSFGLLVFSCGVSFASAVFLTWLHTKVVVLTRCRHCTGSCTASARMPRHRTALSGHSGCRVHGWHVQAAARSFSKGDPFPFPLNEAYISASNSVRRKLSFKYALTFRWVLSYVSRLSRQASFVVPINRWKGHQTSFDINIIQGFLNFANKGDFINAPIAGLQICDM